LIFVQLLVGFQVRYFRTFLLFAVVSLCPSYCRGEFSACPWGVDSFDTVSPLPSKGVVGCCRGFSFSPEGCVPLLALCSCSPNETDPVYNFGMGRAFLAGRGFFRSSLLPPPFFLSFTSSPPPQGSVYALVFFWAVSLVDRPRS